MPGNAGMGPSSSYLLRTMYPFNASSSHQAGGLIAADISPDPLTLKMSGASSTIAGPRGYFYGRFSWTYLILREQACRGS